MPTLLEVQKAADELTGEEQAGLVAHLLAAFPSAPLGPDNDEIGRREIEMESGLVAPLSHDDFLSAVGRRLDPFPIIRRCLPRSGRFSLTMRIFQRQLLMNSGQS